MQIEDLNISSYMRNWPSWGTVLEKLEKGETLLSIAHWLKENEPQAKDRSERGMERHLGRLREKLTKTKAEQEYEKVIEKTDQLLQERKESPKKTKALIDVLDSLGELFEIQMERIREGREIEKKVKYLIARLTQDIGEAREILKFMFEVQQELGLAKRRPMEVEGRFAVLTFEQRQRVGKLLELVRKKIMEKQEEQKLIDSATKEVIEEEVMEGGK
ncbi:MAG: hypothetical protein QXN96_00910 [Candidatus Bathyarchaeia archaeon]